MPSYVNCVTVVGELYRKCETVVASFFRYVRFNFLVVLDIVPRSVPADIFQFRRCLRVNQRLQAEVV